MASEAGWGRLAADLFHAGFDVAVHAGPRGQILRDETPSRSITFQVKDGDRFLGCVLVNDKYGRGGKWYGWTVTAEGPDSITIGRPTYAVCVRPEIVEHFRAAVATLTGRGA